ncbi:amidohydrolase family protein [Corynebacterium sp. HMSC05E07]|uniref:metal-dependent hydrolase family protein n=1 Tax=Corynebacterium sp. HMSC05E07 TaxID=1581117 RepID=UPI0008A625E5|nr:amidohydrolase family protein [Corynebacterium sp. HMSC05E07]OFT57463.1 peptidase M38 [Corynebacterium sp. HMSC05E07]
MPILGITNARILDVESGQVSEPQTISIKNGVIDKIDSQPPADPTGFINAEGKFVSPGLIDCHVHVLATTADLARLGDESPFYLATRASQIMRDMLGRGFTTVRDAGGAEYGLAKAVLEDLVVAPRLFFGGKALSQTGGHADMRNPGTSVYDSHQCCPHIGTICDGVDEVRKACRENIRTGANHIKLMLSGGVASPTDRVDSTQFSEQEIRAAVEEAEAANIYVLGHAYTAKAVNRGLRLGVRSIEHGNLIDDESIRLFKEHDAFLVPTLVTYERLKIDGAENGLPTESQAKVDVVLYSGLKALKRASEAGVSIAFGSDLLGSMHDHQSEEFRIRAKVQTSLDVLRSATTTAARLLGQEGRLGVVAEGAHADLLILNENPANDITILATPEKSISRVIKGGNPVHEAESN